MTGMTLSPSLAWLVTAADSSSSAAVGTLVVLPRSLSVAGTTSGTRSTASAFPLVAGDALADSDSGTSTASAAVDTPVENDLSTDMAGDFTLDCTLGFTLRFRRFPRRTRGVEALCDTSTLAELVGCVADRGSDALGSRRLLDEVPDAVVGAWFTLRRRRLRGVGLDLDGVVGAVGFGGAAWDVARGDGVLASTTRRCCSFRGRARWGALHSVLIAPPSPHAATPSSSMAAVRVVARGVCCGVDAGVKADFLDRMVLCRSPANADRRAADGAGSSPCSIARTSCVVVNTGLRVPVHVITHAEYNNSEA